MVHASRARGKRRRHDQTWSFGLGVPSRTRPDLAKVDGEAGEEKRPEEGVSLQPTALDVGALDQLELAQRLALWADAPVPRNAKPRVAAHLQPEIEFGRRRRKDLDDQIRRAVNPTTDDELALGAHEKQIRLDDVERGEDDVRWREKDESQSVLDHEWG